MAIESRHRSTNNHIILTPLPEQNLTTRQRRRRKRDHSSPVILLAFASAAFLVGFHLNHDSSDSDTNLQRRIIESPPPKEWKASLQHQQEGDASIRPGSVGGVVSFLMNLAEKRPGDLWSLFGMDDDGRRWVFIHCCACFDSLLHMMCKKFAAREGEIFIHAWLIF
jgi:hypothetical protein